MLRREDGQFYLRQVSSQETADTPTVAAEPESGELRKRGKGGKTATSTDESANNDSTLKKPKSRDPLQWFGFMPSPHLRKSQALFKQGTYL